MNDDLFKGYKAFKVAQLCLLIVFGITFFCYLYFDPLLKNNIYTNRSLLSICVFLWAFWIFSLISIVWDFRQLERNITDNYMLGQTAYMDALTGIPNRQSVDLIFNKYDAKEDISDIGCALVSISNLYRINEEFGRDKGNEYLYDFAAAFERVGEKFGFVGRNGGNEFLIVMDECNEDKINSFLNEFYDELDTINSDPGQRKITFDSRYILNSKEDAGSFRELIAALYSRPPEGGPLIRPEKG